MGGLAQAGRFFPQLYGRFAFLPRRFLGRTGMVPQLCRLMGQRLGGGHGFVAGLVQHLLTLGIGGPQNFPRALLGSGAHPRQVVFLLLLPAALAQGRFLQGIELGLGGFPLAHEDSAPFFAQLVRGNDDVSRLEVSGGATQRRRPHRG